MSHTKETGKRKHLIKTMPMLGAAGLSFSLTIGTSAAIGSINSDPATAAQVAGSVMDEEQIFDISLATFRVHDDESAGPQRSGTRRIMVSQGACGADLYLPQSPPAVSAPVYQAPPPSRFRPVRPAYKYRRS